MSADHAALELERQLDGLARRFRDARRPAGRGRVVMFAAARRHVPSSDIARGFARMAVNEGVKPVWLIDLDLAGNRQFKAFSRPDARALYGEIGRAYDASLGQTPFWSVRDATGRSVRGERSLLTMHQVGGAPLFVSRFHGEAIEADGVVRLREASEYWRAARRSAELIVVDAPAREASTSGVALSAQADGVVLCVDDDDAHDSDAVALKAEIEAAGGRCEGLVVVRR